MSPGRVRVLVARASGQGAGGANHTHHKFVRAGPFVVTAVQKFDPDELRTKAAGEERAELHHSEKKITAKVREAIMAHPSSSARGVCTAPLRCSAATLLYYNCSRHRNYEIAREVTA